MRWPDWTVPSPPPAYRRSLLLAGILGQETDSWCRVPCGNCLTVYPDVGHRRAVSHLRQQQQQQQRFKQKQAKSVVLTGRAGNRRNPIQIKGERRPVRIAIIVSTCTEDVSLTAVRQHITPITPNQTPFTLSARGPKRSPLPVQPGWPCPLVPVCPAPGQGSLRQHLSTAPLHSCRRGSPTCAGHSAGSQCASRSLCRTQHVTAAPLLAGKWLQLQTALSP